MCNLVRSHGESDSAFLDENQVSWPIDDGSKYFLYFIIKISVSPLYGGISVRRWPFYTILFIASGSNKSGISVRAASWQRSLIHRLDIFIYV